MVAIDVNVIIEIIENRSRASLCGRYLETCKQPRVVSMLALNLVMYLAEKYKADVAVARKTLEQFRWLPVLPEDGVWAFARFGDRDYEDALQVACAVREGCTRFVTLDAGLAKKYKSDIKIDLIR